ncbi:6-phospho-3-hexuloisomerase [Erysipelothrix urinaevulpis]|uniref:6-phospho-3-hexuloisomerase n=1 Tax=Erysipelothrix urinaevulpis TaxID=2683717 RepID=UPI00135C3079|nr:6-phospho-3-hexuloisomerase [Erysipelothrix urinaevulpis]
MKNNYLKNIEEYKQVVEEINWEDVELFKQLILDANRIILIGVGREGLMTKAFTMRLMHLGLDVHWIWDETTPSIRKGDLLIATSGCGEIGHIHYVVEKAKESEAKVALVTGDPYKKTAKIVDFILFNPAAVYLGDAKVVDSYQPMGNLFEQTLLILFDIIIIDLQEALDLTPSELEAQHRNLE